MSPKELVSLAAQGKTHLAVDRAVDGKLSRYSTPLCITHAEYESWQKTLEVLSSRKELNGMREGLASLQQGDSESFEDVVGEPLKQCDIR